MDQFIQTSKGMPPPLWLFPCPTTPRDVISHHHHHIFVYSEKRDDRQHRRKRQL